MDGREKRGLEIAALTPIKKAKSGFVVPSQTTRGVAYMVNLDGDYPTCNCPDYEGRMEKCKHIWAVEFSIRREQRPDGTTVVTKTVRVTYSQDWHNYNLAQTREQEHFVDFLHALCEGIMQPDQRMGRPRLPLSDAVFAIVLKVYSTMSGRRATGDMVGAAEKGLIDKVPNYSTAARYLENPALTPLLKTLIEESALPLKAVECDFAVDSSGFSTSVYERWFDHKYGRVRSKQTWVKTHLMCGVNTHIVTAVEATPFESADAPQLPALLNTTASTFNVREVSADKAYSSRNNLRAVQAVGAVAYIPFKERTTGMGGHTRPYDPLWHRMWAYYNYNRDAFLMHYHKRSNVETTFSMIKAKFGGRVRSKTPIAQVNEVLCKVLCHNICVLIQSMYELGIEPEFVN